MLQEKATVEAFSNADKIEIVCMDRNRKLRHFLYYHHNTIIVGKQFQDADELPPRGGHPFHSATTHSRSGRRVGGVCS